MILAGIALILLSPFYYGYVLKVFSSAFGWISDLGGNPNYRTYKSLNIPIPSKYSIHGIDVSSYQGKIDWKKVKEMREDELYIKFAFIKATEGLVHVDPYFQRNWREAPKAGIVCGAYHYFKPGKNGKWQAKFFLQNVKPEKGDLPLVVDIEELKRVSPERMRKELSSFLNYIENKTAIKPIIYTNITFYKDYLQGHFDDHILWIAHYYKPELKTDKRTRWRFWQHSDMATIAGINHVVDMNVFNGDSVEFERLLVR
ncbi:glycoside hydrolase family 25 protein [Rubrolithibacter danxiaensis]|uniref:glycoside hydrolase family 25 protein n=1 Tax=Rubrolithibacter danxiaensis TaxID=3390805 RepID=UPI003BF838AB